jgi:OmpA-OmpF porin, OOP family
VMRSVDFEFNSAQLTAPSQQTLDGVASALSAQPELNVDIRGYTDSVGSAAYNKKLSQRRAESVKTYLAGKGVNASNLRAEGFGKADPIASNDTAEGRAQNRRVEFVVTNAPNGVKVKSEAATAADTAAAQSGEQPKAAVKKHHHKKKAAAPASGSTAPATGGDQSAQPAPQQQ